MNACRMECYPHGVGIVEGPCRSLLHTTRPSQRTYNATICFLIDLRYFGWLHMFPYSPSKGALCQEPGKQQTSNYVCCQVVPWTLNCTIHLMYLPWLFGPGHKLTHNRMCKTLSKHVSTPQPQPPNTIPLGGPPLPCSGAPREAKLGYRAWFIFRWRYTHTCNKCRAMDMSKWWIEFAMKSRGNLRDCVALW